uniref:Reverse transcriptase/retrotransposon-derived protein RNase H-like domain-containing protein n=1 Tax=Fagus sylvatica TaxID=28930 RepID=A0A2N9H581_FAGSY
MMQETRAGVPIGVLDENVQRLQQQLDDHRAMMEELTKRQPVVEQPAVQPWQEEQTPNRVQTNLREQIPIVPRGVPLGAEMRNTMPMRPHHQDFRVQANQPRVGMQLGEVFENGQNGPILGEFGDPIEERRSVRNNARFMPPFQGQFDAPYEEPWLGRRQGRQQGQQAQFEHHAAPPRHGIQAQERPRQWQGAHHRDPYWYEQEGPPWHQGRARDPRPMKLDFPRAIQITFGPASYDDPMELLTKLKQTHTIAAYKSQFESTSNSVRDLSDMHKLSCFMSGMKDEIKLAIKMQGPRNLGEAYALAKIQEEYLATVKRSSRPAFEPSRGSWAQSSSKQVPARVENKSGDFKQYSAKPSMPMHRLTPMQMSERRKTGLCYHCDERWSTYTSDVLVSLASIKFLITYQKEKKCKSQSVFMMEVLEDEESEEAECVEMEEEEEEAELEEEKAEITLCALLGSTSPSTKRVMAILNGQKTIVLLDTSSTHNFMDGTLAKELKLQTNVESNFGVRVANGQVIRILGECKEVKFKMQDLHLKLTFNLLDLGGCGIVLGTQWLSTLGLFCKRRFLLQSEIMPYKCVFATNEVEYLGHIISWEGVKTDPKKIAAMVDWPMPKSLKALRGFLGLTGYYRKFIKGYGQIASPLNALLKKDAFLWSDKAEKDFEELKAAVSQPPVLALPDFSQTFVIECDASGFGMGFVLMQGGRPMAYYSQAFKGKNLFLSTYEKELLALVFSVKKWKPYLFATIFTIKTDQQSLKHILEQRVGTPMQQKWISKLLRYHFVVEYKQDKENKEADALSRKEDTDLKTQVERETAYLQAQT